MFFLLFSLSFSYNIRRGNCEVLIDEYYYNFFDFQDIDPIIHPSKDFFYFLRLCARPLEKIETGFDVFLIQTSLATTKMVNVITQNSFDYRPLNASNFEDGIIYYADSEPFESPLDGSIRTLDLEFRIKCDPSVKDINPEYLISDSVTAGKIIISFPHRAGCVASHQSTPTPTPSYEPDCEYIDRLDNETSRGIWADLNFMNDGPYGIKSLHSIEGKDYYLYFQPCERIQCPPNFICIDEGITYSSAWLCNSTLHCISYGVSTESYSFRPIDGDLTKGMQLKFEESTNKRSIELSLTCNSTYPEGHVKWNNEVHFDEDQKLLKVEGETNEVCIIPIPTVTPSPDKDFCKFEDTVGDLYVQIDLQKYNNDEQNGWKSAVDVMAGHDSYPKSQLLFKPCGNITCPPDAFCNGDEDAEIWLCHEISGTLECEGYGLYKNKVTLELYDDDDIKDGIQANYLGDGKRKANVIYLCNESLKDTEILMPESVNLNYRSISFYIYAKDACAKSSPTPITSTTSPQPTAISPTAIPPTTSPDDGGKDRKYSINGGSIFLLILIIGGVFYISIGTLINFIRNGVIEIPNRKFWVEFSTCIETTLLFITSCGKKSITINNYEDIN